MMVYDGFGSRVEDVLGYNLCPPQTNMESQGFTKTTVLEGRPVWIPSSSGPGEGMSL